MTPTDQLARLPEPIQAELWRIVRLAAGMSDREKSQASATIAFMAMRVAVFCEDDDQIPGMEMVSALGVLLHKLNAATTSQITEGV